MRGKARQRDRVENRGAPIEDKTVKEFFAGTVFRVEGFLIARHRGSRERACGSRSRGKLCAACVRNCRRFDFATDVR